MASNSWTTDHQTVFGNMRAVIGTLSWNDATSSGKDTTVSGLEDIYSVTSNHGATLRFNGNAIGSDDATANSTLECLVIGV